MRAIKITWIGYFFLLLFYIPGASAQHLIDYVQPLAGTAPATTSAALKHSEGTEKNANTIPAVGLPFGMTQFTPQTRQTENKCVPPYFYKDTLLNGFRATHWLSGSCTQDYGSFTIMPVAGKLETNAVEYAIPFAHADEISTPSYYKIDLPSGHVSVEITGTLRCGIMQFTMLQDDSLYLLITPNSDKGKGAVKINALKGEVSGYNPAYRIYQGWGNPAGFSGWFFMKIEKKLLRKGTFSNEGIFDTDTIANAHEIGGFAGFYLKKGEVLRVKIGTSFTSLNAAAANLDKEIPDFDFNKIRAAADQAWETALGKIKIQTNNEADKRIFYTSFYHAMQHPRLFSDVDGVYPQFAGNYTSAKMAAGNYYDDFSMWDIYRAQLPLLEILDPPLINQFVRSLILKGQQGGWLPIFPCWNSYTAAMIGDHSSAFIASAYSRGIRGYNIREAYRLMRKNAFDTAAPAAYKNGMGRRALTSYLEYGFIPMEDSVQEAFHKKEQVSRTLEYAFDDYAVSVVARGLGKTNDYTTLRKRSMNYKNIFDKKVGMMRGKYANGKWFESFHADQRESYITEGTPRQYSFYVPQDVPGLVALTGGKQSFEKALDSLFLKNEYWHGNEPGHQVPFLYNYTSAPWKTQDIVRTILKEEYSDGPGGLSGNDDAGQMSAWYMFAAMGFYPVDPVSGKYQLCSPLFDKITVNTGNKKPFIVTTHKNSPEDRFISRMQLNGVVYKEYTISHQQILAGGKLEIWLQSTPLVQTGNFSSSLVAQNRKPFSGQQIKVLVVDGFSNHDWKETTRETKDILEETGMFKVDVSTSPATREDAGWASWDPAFNRYDVVIQNSNNIKDKELRWPERVEKKLEEYVKSGGGLYILHSGNNSFPHWAEYDRMIGLGWRSKETGYALQLDSANNIIRIPPGEGKGTTHGKRFDATIKILNRHPINKGFPNEWITPSMELYLYARGPAENLTVLSYSSDSVTHEKWPVEWIVNYGKGHVYNSSMGHLWKDEIYPVSYRCIGFQTLMIRAAEWLAKGTTTYPMPANFVSGKSINVRAETDYPASGKNK